MYYFNSFKTNACYMCIKEHMFIFYEYITRYVFNKINLITNNK